MDPRRDLAVIIAAVAGVLLVAEQGHHITTDVPARTDRTAPMAACSDTDNAPYDSNCIAYMSGRSWQPDRSQAPPRLIPATAVRVDANGPECATTDNAPYSARCIAFMSGWFWKPE